MRRALHDNGLSLVLGALFLLSIGGQLLTGERSYNAEQRAHGEPTLSLGAYVRTGHFVESVFENWESEFLQMGLLVVLTATLRQRGAPDSKKLHRGEPVDADPRRARRAPGAPWPVRRGGWVLAVYEHSLSIALLLLFLLSFALHAYGGARECTAEQLAHGEAGTTMLGYLGTARFWFESFQNWQSEFFSVAMLTLLSIVLRQRGSPQSKPVASPHGLTGEPDHAPESPPRRSGARSSRRGRGRRAAS
ncbi:MAG TPA: DUF6766 family protein [Gemmatimonadaceae bacterium]|nr:DUF6766 family protein [Gemmatimonadaceae bacterium]